MDAVVITPEPGRAKDIGQLLLTLADHPRDVAWVTYPVAGFSIPLELFRKFTEATDAAEPEPELETEPEPRKRRRGRPRKEDSSTDTDTPEEE